LNVATHSTSYLFAAKAKIRPRNKTFRHDRTILFATIRNLNGTLKKEQRHGCQIGFTLKKKNLFFCFAFFFSNFEFRISMAKTSKSCAFFFALACLLACALGRNQNKKQKEVGRTDVSSAYFVDVNWGAFEPPEWASAGCYATGICQRSVGFKGIPTHLQPVSQTVPAIMLLQEPMVVPLRTIYNGYAPFDSDDSIALLDASRTFDRREWTFAEPDEIVADHVDGDISPVGSGGGAVRELAREQSVIAEGMAYGGDAFDVLAKYRVVLGMRGSDRVMSLERWERGDGDAAGDAEVRVLVLGGERGRFDANVLPLVLSADGEATGGDDEALDDGVDMVFGRMPRADVCNEFYVGVMGDDGVLMHGTACALIGIKFTAAAGDGAEGTVWLAAHSATAFQLQRHLLAGYWPYYADTRDEFALLNDTSVAAMDVEPFLEVPTGGAVAPRWASADEHPMTYSWEVEEKAWTIAQFYYPGGIDEELWRSYSFQQKQLLMSCAFDKAKGFGTGHHTWPQCAHRAARREILDADAVAALLQSDEALAAVATMAADGFSWDSWRLCSSASFCVARVDRLPGSEASKTHAYRCSDARVRVRDFLPDKLKQEISLAYYEIGHRSHVRSFEVLRAQLMCWRELIGIDSISMHVHVVFRPSPDVAIMQAMAAVAATTSDMYMLSYLSQRRSAYLPFPFSVPPDEAFDEAMAQLRHGYLAHEIIDGHTHWGEWKRCLLGFRHSIYGGDRSLVGFEVRTGFDTSVYLDPLLRFGTIDGQVRIRRGPWHRDVDSVLLRGRVLRDIVLQPELSLRTGVRLAAHPIHARMPPAYNLGAVLSNVIHHRRIRTCQTPERCDQAMVDLPPLPSSFRPLKPQRQLMHLPSEYQVSLDWGRRRPIACTNELIDYYCKGTTLWNYPSLLLRSFSLATNNWHQYYVGADGDAAVRASIEQTCSIVAGHVYGAYAGNYDLDELQQSSLYAKSVKVDNPPCMGSKMWPQINSAFSQLATNSTSRDFFANL
jgi:hypothetical protein